MFGGVQQLCCRRAVVKRLSSNSKRCRCERARSNLMERTSSAAARHTSARFNKQISGNSKSIPDACRHRFAALFKLRLAPHIRNEMYKPITPSVWIASVAMVFATVAAAKAQTTAPGTPDPRRSFVSHAPESVRRSSGKMRRTSQMPVNESARRRRGAHTVRNLRRLVAALVALS